MKNILFVIFFSLILSCEDEITVFVDREPGSISGQILPKGVGAIVKLYQGPLFQEVGTDFDGYFQFSNLSAGTYTLRANAPNYGTREFGRIQVEDGEGYDIGQLRLYEYPAPLVYSSPLNGETGVPLHYLDRLVHLYFDEILNLESLRTAFTITPPVSNMILNHETSRYPFPLYHSYYVGGDFKLGTLYEFTIDSTCETITGEKLEFSYSSTFETEHFKLERIIIPTYLYGNYQLILRFNNTINSSTLYNHLSIEPDIDIIIEGQIETAVIYPTLSWMPDTTFKLILSPAILKKSVTVVY